MIEDLMCLFWLIRNGGDTSLVTFKITYSTKEKNILEHRNNKMMRVINRQFNVFYLPETLYFAWKTKNIEMARSWDIDLDDIPF